MSTTIDYRFFHQPIELRSVKKDGYLPQGLQGYAVVYGVESRDMGGWKEIIDRGAMRESLTKKLDVRLLWQHDSKAVMARETAGNLVVREDEHGIFFEADLLDTTANRDRLADVRAKNIDAMSFGMPYSSVQRSWNKTGGKVVSNVTRADMVEISVVTWAAYEETSVAARCAEQFKTFMQQGAAESTPLGISRARHALAQRRYRY